MTRSPRNLLVFFVSLFFLAVLALPLAIVQHPAAAATPPPAVSGGARIDEPRANSSVRGVVRVTGSAALPNFAKYQMYIQRPGSNAFEWKFERNQPVVNGVLWEWNTNPADYPDGNYVIRMWVVKSDGNYDEVTVPVRVDNSSTPTPSVTATGLPVTPTPVRTPTAIVVATPAVIGLAPTATQAPTRVPATPTPMFGIDVAKIVDPTPWVRSFTTGMGVAAACIGFIIALFFARALLRWRP
jgi:hypothetical protein